MTEMLKRFRAIMCAVCLLISFSGCKAGLHGLSKTIRPTVTVTVPEGFSEVQIFKLLDEKKVCSYSALMLAAQTGDFTSDPLVAQIKKTTGRCFTLEGYLFPDTYQFYINQDPTSVINVFLKNTETKITTELQAQAAAKGMTVDQLLTMASIVERECAKTSEYAHVSSVFHNRLFKGMKLQSDATIAYLQRYIQPFITGDTQRYNDFYNTYTCKALPSGPICNPGMAAITAALNPVTSKDLYFVTDAANNYYYAETYAQHLKNCITAGVKTSKASAASSK